MKLKVGFIGVGAMGLSHLRAVHQDPANRAEAVAICSSNATNINKALAIAPRAKVFGAEEALIQSELDAVFISTPNFTHVRLTLAALQAGKHVFAEKPVGISPEECQRMGVAADQTDRVLMIGHELRYSSYFQKIKELVDAGEIGKPQMAWCREWRGPFQKKSRDWIHDERLSGGTLVDKNCHHFDLMNWWIGSRPKSVCAFGGNAVERVIPGEHQGLDHATVSFEYANGARGSLQLCLFAPESAGEDLEMGVIGNQGLIQTRISALQVLVRKRNEPAPVVHTLAAKRGGGWGGHLGFVEMHEAFLQAVLNGRRPLTCVRECVDGTLLAIAAEESIRRRGLVKIE